MKLRPSVLLFLAGLCSLACCLPQYYFINTTLTWSKAQTYCRERNADLATIFNIEDMNRLVNGARDSRPTGKAWIGLHDNLTSWRWSFSNSSYYRDQEANYRNWYYGQPDNFLGDQMCVTMWSGGVWQDTRCSLRNPFICYDGSRISYLPFIFVEQELSWSDAQLFCRKFYTDLASVRNERENKEIQLLANNKSVWIGLYRMREWSDKSVSNYRYWQQGQPDNAGEKQECVATDLGNGGLWSDEECNRELTFICYIDSEEPVLSTTTTTTETPNKITTTEGALTTTKTTSNEILNQTSLATTTTTETPNKITTIQGHSSSPELTSEQPSTLLVYQTTSIPVNPDQRTTSETKSTTSHLSTEITSSEQPSTPEVDQTRPTTYETSTKQLLSTTTITTSTSNKITTIEGDLRRTEMTSSEQPSTTLVDQTTSTPGEKHPTSHEMYHSTITTVTQNKRTASETESTTSHLSTEITSSEEPSTPEVDQTIPTTDETSTKPLLSTTTITTSTSDKITTIEGDLRRTEMTSSEQPSTSLVDQTTSTPEVSSQQYSTPEGGQTRSEEYVVSMRVKLTSTAQMSEDDMEKLFHVLLKEMGLSTSIKVGLKILPKK
ncbi:cell wall protein DAN4-like isoform X3 [Larimichthys crocea]|uniref:cell wall protein DAN4-like isoform X3 n=1 Tax=Larimichthys crocea TaxID=215358 RepID=UPI000F5FCA11|nr:cell wall protein DAN4-like isoform X3 [Larimichthys crocea]